MLKWGIVIGAGFAGILAVEACGAGVPPSPENDASEATDVQQNAGDAVGNEAATLQPTPTQPAIIFIDQIDDATMDLANDAGAVSFNDVRVCIFDSNHAALTTYAVPDDVPMPLTNYPGISVGRGVDLGSLPMQQGPVTIDVFSAGDLQSDAAWVASRDAYKCDAMACAGSSCREYGEFSVMLEDAVNVLVLGDDSTSGHVKLTQTAFDGVAFDGTPGSLHGTVVNFSGWHDQDHVAVAYGNWSSSSGTSSTLEDPLAPNTGYEPGLIAQLTTYEDLGLRFTAFSGQQPFDNFGQSLDSIAFVSNPTTDPITFYSARANFVFALIGDPNDPTSVLADGGRDLSYDRKSLHVVAIPYASPMPVANDE